QWFHPACFHQKLKDGKQASVGLDRWQHRKKRYPSRLFDIGIVFIPSEKPVGAISREGDPLCIRRSVMMEVTCCQASKLPMYLSVAVRTEEACRFLASMPGVLILNEFGIS
ncbi:MAG: hypothetical protein K2Q09_00025, partial [Phycisphaerales bacterium]|nr:hypothetical protein [Phycisphaerales bacterium]